MKCTTLFFLLFIPLICEPSLVQGATYHTPTFSNPSQEKEKKIVEQPPTKLTREQLLSLLAELRKKLRKAVQRIDHGRVEKVANNVAKIDPGITMAVRSLTESFNWDRLLSLLEKEDKDDQIF